MKFGSCRRDLKRRSLRFELIIERHSRMAHWSNGGRRRKMRWKFRGQVRKLYGRMRLTSLSRKQVICVILPTKLYDVDNLGNLHGPTSFCKKLKYQISLKLFSHSRIETFGREDVAWDIQTWYTLYYVYVPRSNHVVYVVKSRQRRSEHNQDHRHGR